MEERPNVGVRYRLADDLSHVKVYENYDCKELVVDLNLGEYKRLGRICFVNIVPETTPEPTLYRMRKVKIPYNPFNDKRIVGWVNLDWIELYIGNDAFDGRFNMPSK